jgi:hypothetical protein
MGNRLNSMMAGHRQPKEARLSAKKNSTERRRLRIRFTARAATPEQEHRLCEAIDLFLAEWVRRRLRQGEEERTCSTTKKSCESSPALS